MNVIDPEAPIIDGWELISSSDNWVYQHGNQVFKTPKPGRESRVLNGYLTARSLGHLGRVLAPHNGLVMIDGHVGTMWDFLDGESDIESTFKAFRWLTEQQLTFGTYRFDPIAKVEARIANMDPDLLSLFSPYMRRLETHMDTVDGIEMMSQHGDPSFENCIDGILIDFDSAGLYPAGWDRACLHYSSLYNGDPDLHEDWWELDDQTRALTPIKWAVSVSWNLEAGRLPPSWECRNQLAWSGS